MNNFFKNNRALILILLGSFLLSVGYSFYFKINPTVDARAYDVIALNIAQGFEPRVNGEKITGGHVLRAGDSLEFVKPSGDKA